MDEVPCCLLSGRSDLTAAIRDFWKKTNVPAYLPFFLALSEHTYEQVRENLPMGRYVLLSAQQIIEILAGKNAHQLLKRIILQQIPRRALIPFAYFRPAEGSMFFGRDEELVRLSDEDFTSFAIAGPGRIGKTSLLRGYRRHMLVTHNHRAARFDVSFYRSSSTDNEAARFLAMEIDPSRRSDRMTASGLVNFLRHMRSIYRRPIELLLDEVDEVCEGEAFRYLGEAAKMGLCRLVLSGKGVLLKMMLNANSPLNCRMDLMQIGPLGDGPATRLLLEPLVDLGFDIDQPWHLSEHVLSLTGRMPILIQIIGKNLAELAIRENTHTISVEHLEKLKSDFLIGEFFVSSLIKLDDPKTRLVGLSLVESGHSQTFTLKQIQEVGNREGLNLDLNSTHDICTDLLINNVLAWGPGYYALANEGLRFFAQKFGYLAAALEEARHLASLANRDYRRT